MSDVLDLGAAYRAALSQVRASLAARLDGMDSPGQRCDASLGQFLGTLLDCGERGLAERVLAKHQDGSIPARPEATCSCPTCIARELLEATHRQIACVFEGQVASFEDHIRQGDGRFAFLLQEAGPLAGARVLDAGCGRGGLARALLTAYPAVELVALDLSPEMLRHVPAAARPQHGSIQNLPFEDGRFDVAYCVEALEHACNPEGAIDELCRVVRPGGRLLIVDKNAERSGALEIEAWESWFERREVERWLGKHCADVRSELLLHCPELGPELFVGWCGTRKGL